MVASILHPERKQNPLLFSLFGLYMYVQIRIIKCCIASNGIYVTNLFYLRIIENFADLYNELFYAQTEKSIFLPNNLVFNISF